MKTYVRVFIEIIFLSFLINSALAQTYLNAGEYFINTDPGEGNGILFYPKDGNFDSFLEEFQIIISTSSLNEGVNTLFIRFKDENGNWGKVLAKPFVVRDASAFYVHLPPKLTNAEYFVDNDPGEGNGTGLNVVDGNFDGVYESVIGSLNTSALSEGIHTLFARLKSDDNTWSKAIAKPFVVRDSSAFFVNIPLKIKSVKYYIDDNIEAFELRPRDNAFDQYFEQIYDTIKTSELLEDVHSIAIRFEDQNGLLSREFYSIFEIKNITPPLQPTGLVGIPRNRRVILSWNRNLDHDISFYIVYRSLESGFDPVPSDSIASVISPDTTYIDNDVSNGTEYFYKIRAVDKASLYSIPSEQIAVIPVNSSPLSFSLLLPADGDTLLTIDEPVLFKWRKSNDIDDDSLSYRLKILGPALDTLVANIHDTTLSFDGKSLFKSSATYEWNVEVTDGLEWVSCEKVYKFNTPYFVQVRKDEKQIPDEFVLLQNYPNPFNPTTTIQFDIPKTSFVTLKVYNVLGQEVAILVNENKNPGKYEINFDASTIPSGVYFYCLTAGEYISTKKLLLVR